MRKGGRSYGCRSASASRTCAQNNGSGSAYNLESAIKLAGSGIKLQNKVRFAFWGAEEENLIGSTFYVNSLSDEEFSKILLNLNFDMIASPNYVRFRLRRP